MKTKNGLFFFALFLFSACIFFGCETDDDNKDSNSIVGTWKIESVDGEEYKDENLYYVFSKNGTVVLYNGYDEYEGEYTIKGGKLTITEDGESYIYEYEIKNKKLYIYTEEDGTIILVRVDGKELEEEKNKNYAPENIIGKRITFPSVAVEYETVLYGFTSAGTCSIIRGVTIPGQNISKTPTYTYSKTSAKEATFNYDYQETASAGTAKYYFNWHYKQTLTFTSAGGGTYTGTLSLNNGTGSFISGTFTID